MLKENIFFLGFWKIMVDPNQTPIGTIEQNNLAIGAGQQQPPQHQQISMSDQANLTNNNNNGGGPIRIQIGPTDQQHIFSHIRSTMERRLHERTQHWRSNLNDVFQEIRPSLFYTWPRTANNGQNNNNNAASPTNVNTGFRLNGTSNETYQHQPLFTNHSYVINLDEHEMQAPGFPNMHATSSRFNSLPEFGTNSGTNVEPQISVASSHPHLEHRPYDQRELMQPIPQLIHQQASPSTRSSTNSQQQQHNHNHAIGAGGTGGGAGGAGGVGGATPATEDGPMAEAFAQIPEARALFNSLVRYVPFISIILAKSCYDHADGILDFFALFITFSHANWILRQEIAKHAQRSVFKLLRELLYIVLVIVVIGFMLEKKNIHITLILAKSYSYPFTLKSLLFSVGVTDLILKLFTVGIKILITLLPGRLLEYKGRVSSMMDFLYLELHVYM